MKIAEKSSPKSITKRLWHIMKVLYYMLHKGIPKHKLVPIVGKAICNLLHHHGRHSCRYVDPTIPFEFSCSSTPFHVTKRKSSYKHQHCGCDVHVQDTASGFEMRKSEVATGDEYEFDTWTPMTRGEEESEGSENQVDRAAEEFIRRFYEQLRLQETRG